MLCFAISRRWPLATALDAGHHSEPRRVASGVRRGVTALDHCRGRPPSRLGRSQVARSWMLRALLTARGIGRQHLDLSSFIDREFVVLEESEPSTIVLGMVGRPHRSLIDRVSVDQFRAYATRGSVRIGWEFHIEGHDEQSILRTETRIQATDHEGLRAFRRYWRFIKPFSGLTRVAMLRVIKRAAERPR